MQEFEKLPPYYYDPYGYYAYVLLNTSEEEVKAVRETLIRHGLSVFRYGPSYRPAANGVQYKWYIRIGEGGNVLRKPKAEVVNKVLSEFFGVMPLSEQIREARQIAQKAWEEAARLKSSLEREIQETRKALLENEKALQRAQEERRRLEQRHSEERQAAEDLLEEAMALQEALRRENEALQKKVENLQRELESTKSWALQMQEALERAKEVSGLTQAQALEELKIESTNTFSKVMGQIFDRLIFVEGSLEWILEAPDRKHVLRLLWQIQNNDSIKKKRFQSSKSLPIPWMEVVMKGDSRIYYAPYKGKVHVCVLPKEQQDHVNEVLKRHVRSIVN